MTSKCQANISDLPDWTCPPYVSQILDSKSYGTISFASIVYDAQGYLWVNGTSAPIPALTNHNPVVYWISDGLALYVPKERTWQISRKTGYIPGSWIRVASVTTEFPDFEALTEKDDECPISTPATRWGALGLVASWFLIRSLRKAR